MEMTRDEENHALHSLIKKSSLDEYVALWNIMGTERLNEVIAGPVKDHASITKMTASNIKKH